MTTEPKAPDNVQLESSLTEIAAWLSNIRMPGVFDTRAPFAIVPESLTILDLEKHMPVPSRIRKKIMFSESASFLDYFTKFLDTYKPQIFTTGSYAGMKILCVFDYDGAGQILPVEGEPEGSTRNTLPQPMWNSHQAFLALNYHPDYAELKHSDSKWFKQGDFALFVEENLHLFVMPDAATMLELAQELKGSRNVGWQKGQRLASGANRLEYIETVDAKSVRGEIEVPEYLFMKMPIFEGYAEQEIKAAFRWRMDADSGVHFSYRLLTKVAERKAIDEVKAEITATTNLPLYSVSSFDGIVTRE